MLLNQAKHKECCRKQEAVSELQIKRAGIKGDLQLINKESFEATEIGVWL